MTRKLSVALVALCALFGCGHAPKIHDTSGTIVGKCPLNSKTFNPEFREDRAPLPEGVVCLNLPLRNADYISRWFRDSRHPFLPGKHTGVDFPAKVGTLVFAPAAGTVTRASPSNMDTNVVAVDMGDGWSYRLGHLRVMSVKKGQRILRGQVLGLTGGKVGDPGSGPCTTGPHLHYAVKYKGALVDPLQYSCDGYRP